jgi:hypothetical protein
MVTKKEYSIAKGVVLRALRAFIAGFLSVAVTISLGDINSWTELGTALGNITLAGIVGGISALIMAGDKYFRIK